MAYTLYNDYSGTTWFLTQLQPDAVKQVLDVSFEQLGTFSSTTNWEKVFELGDKINRELKLSEKDIVNEVITFRKKSKR